ncbi:DNA sulfur modification protein DndB [Arthrobacter sp. CAU 1506]|uniref:DNA sulfur modification protein DndB n=1 Tax=Arthrobacter sp. CAU 1506 TaxID=2560052 RepID=UPI0010AD5B03|nr:DNA sulfur modification protein DndB [Arthrobacter sp. CAU 1506]TJY69473.1 DNA sulfur modification protein DndB [Arthrobacter sp. CAU 1506]
MPQKRSIPPIPGGGVSSAKSGEFEYAFPAIRGVQAGHEYYVTMCPLRIVPRLFLYNEEELPPEMRAQRSLNKARVPEMARYIVENPDSYIFSALTASVNADVRFESPLGDTGPAERVGTLTIPMSATFIINDGQHRRAAIQQALTENPALGDETIAIVMFIDVGLNRCQQMFADLNRYAIRPAKSIGVLYDHRDPMAAISRLVVSQNPLLSDLTEMESSNLAPRSRKLFTLSALHTATSALLNEVKTNSLTERVDLATEFWRIVAGQFSVWQQVYRGEVTAGEVRQDFIHTHSIALHALGRVGNTLLRESPIPYAWEERLGKLRTIDWHRNNADTWEGRATTAGKVSKSRTNVELTTAYIRTVLGMPLPPDEQRAEDAFTRGEK